MPECHLSVYSLNIAGLSVEVMSQFCLKSLAKVWERPWSNKKQEMNQKFKDIKFHSFILCQFSVFFIFVSENII